MKIENLDSVEFEDDRFRYGRVVVPYDDITGIEFTATQTRHNVSFIPVGSTYQANLYVHRRTGKPVHVRQARGFFGNKQRMEAVWKVREILSEITFKKRVERYEKHIEENGALNYKDFVLTRAGDLKKNGRLLLNIHEPQLDVRLGPFQLALRRQQSMGQRIATAMTGGVLIDISLDRDCILYILKKHFGWSFKNEHYREKRRDPRDVFLHAVISLGARLCIADGKVDPEELAAFRSHFQINSINYPEAPAIFNASLKDNRPVRAIAQDILDQLAEPKRDLLEYVILGLLTVAMADGRITPSENSVLVEAATTFGFTLNDLDHMMAMVEGTRESGASREESRSRREEGTSRAARTEEQFHLAVLALSDGASVEEIKTAYRRLARQHHPDNLRAQGLPVDQIARSEEMLKIINVSYAWLMQQRQRA